jgi:hypothetical protein
MSARPFAELRDSGLLWLLNRVVFHPRGYALALHFEGAAPELGECTGWSLMGDGSEPWSMGDPSQGDIARGAKTEAELFDLVKALLA